MADLPVPLPPADGEPADGAGVVGRVFGDDPADLPLRVGRVREPLLQKVSGCFRTEEGAAEFCRLRSYVSTMKKQGHSVMETIRSLFAGKVLMPALRC